MRKKYIIIGCSILAIILVILGLLFCFNRDPKTNTQLENNMQERKVKTQKEDKTKDNTDNENMMSNKNSEKEKITKEDTISNSSNTQKQTSKSNANTSTNSTVKKSNTNTNTNNNTHNSSNNSQSQSNSNNQSNVSTSTTDKVPAQPEKDPNAVDTSHILYPTHHGIINYYTLEMCNNEAMEKEYNNPNIASASCVEVYSNAGNVLGYYLEIRYY